MKRSRLGITVLGILAIASLVFIAGRYLVFREPDFISRFEPLMAELEGEEHLSSEEVSQILQQSTDGPVVITAIQHDTSRRLDSVPPIAPQQSRPDPDLNELHPLPNRGVGRLMPQAAFLDPVLQEGPVSANIAAPVQNFEGVSNVNGVLPPDTNGDVGPNHYVEWVNLSFAIYSKTGTLLYGPAAGNTLWLGFGGPCETTNDGDPIVQYDHLADRWMMSQFALPNYPSGPFYQCIAVSQTSNPTGAWYRYAFQISATKVNDYPHFGVWPDGYYMSVNQFVGNTWAGEGVVAFERSKMLLGQPAQAIYFDLYNTDPNLGGMLPSDLDGQAPPAGAPNYFVEADDNGFGYPQDQLQIWAFHADWSNPAASTFNQSGVLPTAAFDSDMCAGSRNCIPQQGTTRKLDAISDRLMYRLQYRNFGAYQTMVVNHTVDVNGADRAGIRWYELRNSGAGWSIFQQGTFSPDATSRWMGSAAMDALGNIALGYSASSATIYPAIRYTGRVPSDPAGTLSQGEGTIINGTGAQTHTASRWGDYSMLAVDPVDGCTFWYTNEYVQTTGSSPWRTRIGSFRLPGCSGPAPTPTFTPTSTLTPTPSAGGNPLYLSLSSGQTIGGVTAADEDILRFDGQSWSLYFDGSDVGVGSPDLFSFYVVDANTILMSFNASVTINGMSVTPRDIVRFNATSLGPTTQGSFSMYFNGIDVGLDVSAENIDALSLLPDGRVLISTTGNPVVTGVTGARDEDVLAFTPTNLGTNTSGTWAMYFDGSDVGLADTSGEDVDALHVAGNDIYLSTWDVFSVSGVSGADEDVFVCSANLVGDTTACTFSPTLYFDGSTWGLSANDVDGFNLASTGPIPTPATPTPTNTGAPPPPSPTPSATLPPSGGSTGWVSPGQATALATGDGNGYELNPTNAFANDGLLAVDTNSGTTTGTTCSDSGKDRHKFLNFNISIPAGTNVQGIEVRLDAKADSTVGAPGACVSITWNSGSSWSSWKPTGPFTTAEASYIVGGPADLWGHAWLPSEVSSTTLQIRIADVASDNTRDFSLDWIAVRVTFQ